MARSCCGGAVCHSVVRQENMDLLEALNPQGISVQKDRCEMSFANTAWKTAETKAPNHCSGIRKRLLKQSVVGPV